MMSPGITEHPEHKITTEHLKKRVEVYMEGERVADTIHAIELKEVGQDPVLFIPKKDLNNITFTKHGEYHSAYIGYADLYNVRHRQSKFENAALAFEHPYDEFTELIDHVAFYPNKVQEIRVTG
ncbi:MAG: DUF427 domain-containing protein [Bacteriovorax sp.]